MGNSKDHEHEGKKIKNGVLDKNDPLNYIGGKFLDSDGYINNVLTRLHQKPNKFPFGNTWKDLIGSSYHKTTWVPVDTVRDDNKARRRLERDPNHPMWEPRYALLRWWHIRISLLGSDIEGRQHLVIRKGNSEPIYLRVGRQIEVFAGGNRIWPV